MKLIQVTLTNSKAKVMIWGPNVPTVNCLGTWKVIMTLKVKLTKVRTQLSYSEPKHTIWVKQTATNQQEHQDPA